MSSYMQRHLRGHINYYAVSGNIRKVTSYSFFATKLLFKWLNRRSQRRSVTWDVFAKAIKHLSPPVRVKHNLYPKPKWMA